MIEYDGREDSTQNSITETSKNGEKTNGNDAHSKMMEINRTKGRHFSVPNINLSNLAYQKHQLPLIKVNNERNNNNNNNEDVDQNGDYLDKMIENDLNFQIETDLNRAKTIVGKRKKKKSSPSSVHYGPHHHQQYRNISSILDDDDDVGNDCDCQHHHHHHHQYRSKDHYDQQTSTSNHRLISRQRRASSMVPIDSCRNQCCPRRFTRPAFMVWRRFRKILQKIVNHNYFQQAIFLAILLNTFSMGIEYHNQPESLSHAVEISNIIFTGKSSLPSEFNRID